MSFNYDVEVLSGASVTVTENNLPVAEASSVTVDPADGKRIIVSFPETTLYNGHKYTLTLHAGSVGVAGEPDVVNTDETVLFEGASYRYFGIGRVAPPSDRPESHVTMDAVTVPFKFPVIEGSEFNYGFAYVKDAKYPATLYKGTETDGETVATVNGEPENDALLFKPTCELEPGTQYTLVIDEGLVKAYAIGDPRNSYLKDYISEKVVLTYWTPTVEQLGDIVIGDADVADNSEVDHLGTLTFAFAGYEFDGMPYDITRTDNSASYLPGVLYEVTADGEKEVKRFKFTKYSTSGIVADIDADLYEGHTYRVVIPEKTFKIMDSNFLGRYVFSREKSLTLIGSRSTESETAFTANIAEGQKVSHIGVLSFYTESGVTPTEGASLEIRKDGEAVATAPLRVSAEEGYNHIYADFSDAAHKPFATEKGAAYAAVLPKGALADAANENLLNKEYSVPFSGLDEDVVIPEPVYHNVTLNIDNAVAQTSAVEEGKTVSFALTPADGLWVVESVEGAELKDGLYVTAPVTADLGVTARFALANPVDFDFSTGVGEIEGCDYKVYSENGNLVIAGVDGGDAIRIYTVGGTMMAGMTVPAGMDIANINLEPGIYVVVINDTTLKVRH